VRFQLILETFEERIECLLKRQVLRVVRLGCDVADEAVEIVQGVADGELKAFSARTKSSRQQDAP
jgi:hypothetical protein